MGGRTGGREGGERLCWREGRRREEAARKRRSGEEAEGGGEERGGKERRVWRESGGGEEATPATQPLSQQQKNLCIHDWRKHCSMHAHAFKHTWQHSGSNWKLLDRAAMCDATLMRLRLGRWMLRFWPAFSSCFQSPLGERNEASASPPVASGGHLDPEARAGAGAATDSEDTVCVPLVDAMLEGSGAMAPVLLVYPACESDLKGYVSIVFACPFGVSADAAPSGKVRRMDAEVFPG